MKEYSAIARMTTHPTAPTAMPAIAPLLNTGGLGGGDGTGVGSEVAGEVALASIAEVDVVCVALGLMVVGSPSFIQTPWPCSQQVVFLPPQQ